MLCREGACSRINIVFKIEIYFGPDYNLWVPLTIVPYEKCAAISNLIKQLLRRLPSTIWVLERGDTFWLNSVIY